MSCTGYKKIAAALIGLTCLMVSGAAPGRGQELHLTVGEWGPYCGKYLDGGGILCRITQEAFALENVKVEFHFYQSWKRCYILAQKGRMDGSIAWTKTAEREKDFYFSDPVIAHDIVFFHLKELNFHWQTLADLAPFRLNVTSAYTYGREFDTALEHGRLTAAHVAYEEISNFKNLLRGRADIFPLAPEVGYALLKRNFTPEEQARITHHPKSLAKIGVSVVISKQMDPKRAGRLLAALRDGISKLKQNGRFRELLSPARCICATPPPAFPR